MELSVNRKSISGQLEYRKKIKRKKARNVDNSQVATPFLLRGKRILQELCKSDYGWEVMVSGTHRDD